MQAYPVKSTKIFVLLGSAWGGIILSPPILLVLVYIVYTRLFTEVGWVHSLVNKGYSWTVNYRRKCEKYAI